MSGPIQGTGPSRPLLNSGAIAQLGERFNGIEEVVGSIPSGSTKFFYIIGYKLIILIRNNRIASVCKTDPRQLPKVYLNSKLPDETIRAIIESMMDKKHVYIHLLCDHKSYESNI